MATRPSIFAQQGPQLPNPAGGTMARSQSMGYNTMQDRPQQSMVPDQGQWGGARRAPDMQSAAVSNAAMSYGDESSRPPVFNRPVRPPVPQPPIDPYRLKKEAAAANAVVRPANPPTRPPVFPGPTRPPEYGTRPPEYSVPSPDAPPSVYGEMDTTFGGPPSYTMPGTPDYPGGFQAMRPPVFTQPGRPNYPGIDFNYYGRREQQPPGLTVDQHRSNLYNSYLGI